MDSIDLEVLKTAAGWIAAGLRCQLVTVIKTWGSSPRPIGALLAICETGQVVGSVSGGCIEDDLIAEVRPDGTVTFLGPKRRTVSACPAAAPSNWRSSRWGPPAVSASCWSGWTATSWWRAASTCAAAL